MVGTVPIRCPACGFNLYIAKDQLLDDINKIICNEDEGGCGQIFMVAKIWEDNRNLLDNNQDVKRITSEGGSNNRNC